MQLSYLISFLACTTRLSIAYPHGLENRAGNQPSNDAVTRAVDNFARDADTVSAALNNLPTLTDKNEISTTARRAFDAESDEDNQRSVLAAAAGGAGDRSNSLIMRFTPAVLDGLDAIARAGTIDAILQNLPAVERARNPNILPSITQLSNAALDALGINNKQAKNFPPTTGTSKLAQIGGNGGNGGNNNNNNNNDGGRDNNNNNDGGRNNNNDNRNGRN